MKVLCFIRTKNYPAIYKKVEHPGYRGKPFCIFHSSFSNLTFSVLYIFAEVDLPFTKIIFARRYFWLKSYAIKIENSRDCFFYARQT